MFKNILKITGTAVIAIFLFSTLKVYAKDDVIFGRKKSMKLEVTSAKMINQVDKPVEIIIVLKNMIEEAIDIVEPAIDEKSFMIEITMPDGKKDSLLDIYGLELKTVRLYPKKRIKFKAEFTPEAAGNYDITVKYNGFSEEKLESDPITVFVVSSKGD